MANSIKTKEMQNVAKCYLNFIKLSSYKKIEEISDECVKTFSTSKSRGLVLAVRGFMGFGYALSGSINETKWYANQAIASLEFDDVNKRFKGDFPVYIQQRAGNQWIDWNTALLNAKNITDGNSYNVWFFSNGVKCLQDIETKLDSFTQPKVQFQDKETAGDIANHGKALLISDEFKQLKLAVKGLWPSALSSTYQVLKYSRASGASWSKDIGATPLSLLKKKFDLGLTDADKSISRLSEDIVNAFGEVVNSYDNLLEKIVTGQMSILADDAKLTKDSATREGFTVTKDIKLLAVLKVAIMNDRRYMLKDLNAFHKSSQMALASVAVSASVTNASLKIIGGVVGVGLDGVRQMFENIGSAAADVMEKTATLPVKIGEAKIEFLETEVSRLISVIETVTENYKLALELDK
ncbi:hypothetical protein [Marinomonas mediterranea]|uniref:hypothetical protein n=1 Tax=Marinomonas mediterranea TaxID=119864 RepID=UPI0023497AE9|nr:hypothetical protein [Marinomonas mediterranea]WCN09846.1 hypothetical protein GV055_13435 [Marinomonas mediterranea]WCN13930.1 hypothetical protein GV054_13450 [Marinomonas mediterranea]